MKIHYLQHVPFETPGSILEWAAKNGYPISSTQLYKADTLPETKEFDWLIIMGGPMNIYEEDKFPWLAGEKALIREAAASGKVILGLCLGGQLIADALGGKVTQNPVKEIGWFPVHFSKEARELPFFSFLPQSPTVFQWHGDTFSSLPYGAVSIARSEACENQAFIYNNRVFGFQFHLENTLQIIHGLVENCADEMAQGGEYVQTPEEILAHPEYIAQDNAWMDRFLTCIANMYEKGELQ